LFQREATSDKD